SGSLERAVCGSRQSRLRSGRPPKRSKRTNRIRGRGRSRAVSWKSVFRGSDPDRGQDEIGLESPAILQRKECPDLRQRGPDQSAPVGPKRKVVVVLHRGRRLARSNEQS